MISARREIRTRSTPASRDGEVPGEDHPAGQEPVEQVDQRDLLVAEEGRRVRLELSTGGHEAPNLGERLRHPGTGELDPQTGPVGEGAGQRR